MVNKRVRNAVLGCSLKNDRMVSVHFQGKPFNITVIQVYAPTSNAEEADVERFYEDLLLLLSRFSHVRLCATPETAAHQAPLSLGFLQQHWSGLPFPSPMHQSESEVAQSCPTPSDPMDCSPPGSSVHGIFQARVLEWGAISFSEIIC